MGFNEKAEEIQRTLNLDEALSYFHSADFDREVHAALNARLGLEKRLENQRRACGNCIGFTRAFKEEDERAKRVISEASRLLKEYEIAEAKRDELPKSHVDREKQTFDLGVKAAFFLQKSTEALVYFDDTPRFLASLNFIREVLNRNAESLRLLQNKLGDQQGPSYYHGVDKDGNLIPYYSGPANAPQRPTVDPSIPGWAEDPETEKCWCAWCGTYQPKPKSDNPHSKCEDFAHKCVDGEMRMLTTAIKQGGDKRKPFNPDVDFKNPDSKTEA